MRPAGDFLRAVVILLPIIIIWRIHHLIQKLVPRWTFLVVDVLWIVWK
jgi:hypothetical protein